MNFEQIEMWKEGVMEHTHALDTLINDRKLLKQHLEDHLSQFFDWEEIEYDKEFNCIQLIFKKDVEPVIRFREISRLGMDWKILSKYDNMANRIVVIRIYPFGYEGE